MTGALTLLDDLRSGKLETLEIKQIPPADWTTLANASKSSSLQFFALSAVTVTAGVAEAAVLQILREHQSTLRTVALEGIHLSANSAKTYADALPWKTLDSLSLANNAKLGPRGIKTWCEYFKKAETLVDLDCESCGVGYFGAQALGQVLPRTLVSLNLASNKLMADGIWKMASRLGMLKDLTILNLSHNQIGDDGCLELARHVPISIQVLRLAGNVITDSGVTEMIQALPGLPHLQQLDLSKNQLTNTSAKRLGKSLQKCRSLTHLNLSHNEISDDGCVAIVEGLLPNDVDEESEIESEEDEFEDYDQETNRAEKILISSGVSTTGDDSDGPTISPETVLRELHLDHNAIGDEGAGAFVEHLDQISFIETVSLQGNVISDARMRILDMLLKHRSSVVSPRKVAAETTFTTPEQSEREEEGAVADTLAKESLESSTVDDKSTVIEQSRKLLLTSSGDEDVLPELPMSYFHHITGNWGRLGGQHTGAFGRLFRAIEEDSVTGNALWLVRRVKLSSAGKMESLRKAVLAELSQLRHMSIAPVRATSVDQGFYAILYQIPDSSFISLEHCLSDADHRKELTWPVRLNIALSIAGALQFLHGSSSKRRASVHGDLHPGVVLISSSYDHIVLLDAGMSRLLATDRSRFSAGDVVYGSRAYRCPRYERGSAPYDATSDVFSLGVMLAELMTSRLQRTKDHATGLGYDVYYDNVLAHRPLRPDPVGGPVTKILTQTLSQVVLACMSPLPSQRPHSSTVAQILQDLSKQL